MKRYTYLLLLVLAILVSLAPATQAAPATNDARGQLQRVWRQAQAAGAYDFDANVKQTVIPLATIGNAGRASKDVRFQLEGSVRPAEQEMQMVLYAPTGTGPDGIEVQVAEGETQARQGTGPWQSVDNISDLFAPQGDFLAYLAAAQDIVDEGQETRAVPLLGEITFTRYTFALDGPGFARHMAEQMEAQLRDSGELPPGMSLTPPDDMAEMTGQGELWVGEDGLPLRQILTLSLPDRADEQQVEAEVVVNFHNFEAPLDAIALMSGGALLAKVLPAAGEAAIPVSSMFVSLFFVGLVINFRRSRKLYSALAIALIFAMLVGPMLQGHHAEAFNERNETAQAQQAAQAQTNAASTVSQLDPMSGRQLAPAAGGQFAPSAQETVEDPNADSDGDGLTDGQEAELGINPLAWDSDGDLITDTLEINGFAYGGETWYTDPLSADSNNDGLADTVEWGTGAVPPDTDGDGVPDLFDYDNDGDGVPDAQDLSPQAAAAGPFDDNSPLELVVDNLAVGQTSYVEFQLRPTDPAHLWYAFNVLDWPGNDSAGLMQDEDNKTFFDLNPDLPRSPNDNGDLKLVPMLEILVAPDAGAPTGNLPINETTGAPDETFLQRYGVSLVTMPDERLAAYVPLQLVSDEQEGQVAFYGKMPYQPQSETWGNAHQVRLVWVIQALVDNVPDESNQTSDNQLQIVHVYDDAWTLTGLNVREDLGISYGTIYEDPASDADLNNEAQLLTLAYNLGRRFLTGQPDASGAPELGLPELKQRFDLTSTATITERWGLDQQFGVETYDFGHQDEALMTMALTETRQVLSGFTPHWSAAAPISPTLLLVSEQTYRAANLDLAGDGNNVDWDGATLTLNLPGSGEDAILPATVRTLNAQPYFYDEAGAQWQTYPIQDYWRLLSDRYQENEAGDSAEIAEGKTVLLQLYYLMLANGLSNVVQLGEVGTGGEHELLAPPSDEDLTSRYVQDALVDGKALLKKILASDLLSNIAGKSRLLAYLGDAMGQNASLKPASSTPDVELLWKARSQLQAKSGTRTSIDTVQNYMAVILTVSLVTVDVLIATGVLDPEDPGVNVAQKSIIALNAVSALYDAAKAIKDTISLVRAASAALKTTTQLGSAARSARALKAVLGGSSEAIGASKKAGIAGLVIEGILIWGIFIWTVVDAGVQAFSITFNALLAGAIAATILAVLFFILALTVIGAIIVALVALFDLIASLFCNTDSEGNQTGFCFTISGWLTAQLTKLIYGVDTMVELVESESNIKAISLGLGDPDRGYADDNTLTAQLTFEATIRHKNPDPWQAVPYLWLYSTGNLRSTSLNYRLGQGSEPTGITPNRGANASIWTNIQSDHTYWGKTMYRAEGEFATQTLVDIPLEAGINYDPSLYLGVGYALPAIECWTVPLFFPPFVAPVCYTRTLDGEIDGQPLTLNFDIFPATLDEFYTLASSGNGGFRLGWDSKFPTQMDADGDGLLSKAHGGLDPNDSLFDTDGDGLPDGYERQWQADGMPVNMTDPVAGKDTDGDGICDLDEARLGTNPAVADSDGDGLFDGQEVWHQVCGTTEWTGGWIYITEDGAVSTRVTSSPTDPDSDDDGLNDRAEFSLLTPYHPRVWNPNPVGLYTEIGGEALVHIDNQRFILPGDSFGYTATVQNHFDLPLYTRGVLGAQLPANLSSGGLTLNDSGGANGSVLAIAEAADGSIYVGGNFSNAGAVAANRVARWDGANWHALGSGLDGVVRAIAFSPNGDVYMGGDFENAGGAPASKVARWDGANWHALGTGLDSAEDYPRALDIIFTPGGDLYVTGRFLTAGSTPANNIARWDGASWHALGDNNGGGLTYPDGYPADGISGNALAVGDNGDVYVGGYFEAAGGDTATGGIAADNIARWDGQSWHALGAGLSSFEVTAVTVAPSGDVYASMWYTLSRWDGESWQTIGNGVALGDAPAFSAIAADPLGNIYTGGDLTSVSGVPVTNLARWNGTSWAPLGSGTSGGFAPVHDLQTGSGGDVLVGGNFTNAGGQSVSNLALWNNLFEAWPTANMPTKDFTLAPGEADSLTATIDVDPGANGPAQLNTLQSARINPNGTAGWSWSGRSEQPAAAANGQRPWFTDLALAPGWPASYALAVLQGDAGNIGDDSVTNGQIIVYPAGEAIGAPIIVESNSNPKAAEPPAIACAANGNCLVVWAEQPGGDFNLYGRIIHSDGTMDPRVNIATSSVNQRNERAPAVASDGTDFLVAWREDFTSGSLTDFQIWINLVTNDGAIPDPINAGNQALKRLDDKITTSIRKDDYLDVAWTGDAFSVVWENFTGSSRILEEDLDSRALAELRADERSPLDVDADVWLAEASNGDGRYISASILAVDDRPDVYTHLPQLSHNPNTGQTLVVYRQANDEGIRGRLVDGASVGGEFFIGEKGNDRATFEPRLAFDPAQAGWVASWGVVAWEEGVTQVSAANFQNVSGDGERRGAPQQYVWGPDIAQEGMGLACPAPFGERLFWLRMDEGPGAVTFADDSGFDRDATCSGGLCPAPAVLGQQDGAVRFDGATDALDATAFDINNDFTIALWAYVDEPAQSGQNLIGKHNSSGGNQVLFGLYSGLHVRIYGSTYEAGAARTGWQHLTAVGRQTGPSTTEVTVYQDGDQVWQQTLNAVVGDVSGGKGWTIGQDWDSSSSRTDFFGGMLDDIRIYDGAFTAQQVQTLYQSYGAAGQSCLHSANAAAWDGNGSSDLFLNPIQALPAVGWMGTVNSPVPVTETVHVDGAAPTSAISITQYSNVTGTLVFGGAAGDAASGVALVEVSVDNPAPALWGVAAGRESWAYAWQTPPGEGSHTIYSRATDALGNVQATPSQATIILDRTSPELFIYDLGTLVPAQNEAGQWTVTLYGAAVDPDAGGSPGSGIGAVEVLLSPNGNGWQQADIGLPDWGINYILAGGDGSSALTDPTGAYTVTVRATDGAGNHTSTSEYAQHVVELDGRAPEVSLTATGVSTRTITQTVALGGIATDAGPVSSGVAGVEIAFRPADDGSISGAMPPDGGSVFLVNGDDDSDDGTCDSEHCSLREAINAANAAAGADTIEFAPQLAGGTILLASPLPTVSEPLFINGPGDLVLDGSGNGLFTLNASDVVISGLTIQNGAGSNGAVYVQGGTVTFSRVTFKNNGNWAALYINSATVDIYDSSFLNNSVGAIYNSGSTLLVEDSLFRDNERASQAGAIWNSGTLTVNRSTFDNNMVYGAGSGGAIYGHPAGIMTITNSTFSNNLAAGSDKVTPQGTGGAIWNGNVVYLINSTLTGNKAGWGGGLYDNFSASVVFMRNTIIADSVGGNCSFINNLQQVNSIFDDTSCEQPATTDILLDPALADNGGATPTHALLAGSVAIDAGSPTFCPAIDQRSIPRPQGAGCDIGAVEHEWQDVTLDQPGAISTAWSYMLTEDLEGVYQIDLRASDTLGNNDENRVTWNKWRGEIDTMAPRLAVTYTHVMSGGLPYTYLEGWAEDFNLSEASLQFGCEVTAADRHYYESDWWQTWADMPTRLERLTPACFLEEHQAGPFQIEACDSHNHCALVEAASPSAQDVSTIAADTALAARQAQAAGAIAAPPTIQITGGAITAAHQLPYVGGVNLRGVVSASAGIDQVTVSVDGGPAIAAAFDEADGSWRYPWSLGSQPDGQSYNLTATVHDSLGATAQHSLPVTVDIAPPTPFTVTTGYLDGGTPVAIEAGETVFASGPTLLLDWTASSDGTGIARYYAGWSSGEAPSLSALTEVNSAGPLHLEQVVGEAQILYVHVVAEDANGNQTWQTDGPIYVDGPNTPGILDLSYANGIDSGCAQIGASRELSNSAASGASRNEIQRLFATWNANSLRLTWTGASWEGDGDLYIYLDTTGGGSPVAVNYAAGGNDHLPPGMAADYLVWAGADFAALHQEDGSHTYPFLENLTYHYDDKQARLDILIPFASLGSPASLKLLALGRDADSGEVWAAMPDKNPVNHPLVINPLAQGKASNPLHMTHAFELPSLGGDVCPNEGRFSDSDLSLDVGAAPSGVEVGFLTHDLYNLLVPGMLLDVLDSNGEPDMPLPLDVEPVPLGDGQTVTYTIDYINRGTEVAPGVVVTATAYGALRFNGSSQTIVNLGDVAPGITQTAQFLGQIDTALDPDSAEMVAAIGDANHGTYDYRWVLHPVDSAPPQEVAFGELAFAGPNSNQARGSATDSSGINAVEVRVDGGAVFNCPDATPTDGHWQCAWDAAGASNGALVQLEARAVDPFGNWSDWSAPVMVQVDAVPPTISVSAGTAAALASVVRQTDELTLSGLVSDDQQAAQAEICNEDQCSAVGVSPGTAVSGTWQMALGLDSADNVTQTLALYGHDAAGNRSLQPLLLSFRLDNISPQVTANQVATQIPLTRTLVLNGSAVDGSGISSVAVRVVAPDGSNYWESGVVDGSAWSYSLRGQSAGWHQLTVRVMDGAGNIAETGPYAVNVTGCAAAPLAPVLDVSVDINGMTLSWTDVGADMYEIWSSPANDPYFTPGSDCAASAACVSQSGTELAMPLPPPGNPDVYSFVVRAVQMCGGSDLTSPASNRGGLISFSIAPGD